MGDLVFNLYLNLYSFTATNHLGAMWLWSSETIFFFCKDAFVYYYSTNYVFVFTLKLATCLVFLSAIRGGVPRYRYDFLTKMGWVKFLGLVLSAFLFSFFLFLIW